MPRIMRLVALLAALCLLVALGGCLFNGEDDDDDDPITPPAWIGPQTPDELMTAFGTIYGGCDLERLAVILDEDFRFITQDATEYDQAAALAIHGDICGGVAGDSGIAIEDITVEYLNPVGVWDAVAAEDPHFGTVAGALFRPYNVFISYKIAGENLIFQAHGLAIFYALPGDEMVTLLGIDDQTAGHKGTESHSWSSIWALFD